MKTLSIISLLALLTLKASAAVTILLPFTANFAITANMQNPVKTTTTTTITVPAFTKNTITTKSLLPVIAQDEFNAGKYGPPRFLQEPSWSSWRIRPILQTAIMWWKTKPGVSS